VGLKFGKFDAAVRRLKEQVAGATRIVSRECFHITEDNHKVGNCGASDRDFLLILVLRSLIYGLVVEITILVRLSRRVVFDFAILHLGILQASSCLIIP
jgi:hypothetical protein